MERGKEMTLEDIYLVVLIVVGFGTLLYFFFGDMVDGAGEGIPFFDPAVAMAFVTMTSAAGYLFERFTTFQSVMILIMSMTIAIGLTSLLYFFVLVPLRSAEVSLVYTEDSLAGQVGKVIIPIPKNGFGEVMIEAGGGIVSKRAVSMDNKEIDYDQEVLIIEVKNGTLFVKEYKAFWLNT